ncbi:hypothetical protein N9N08_00385 [bacterium]|jgi:hypothetical protein|nr:hypothetical protein [bacterium]|tara:strand:- start:170 stop:466 length:297 start_codon:yes stop_codon:yes gene_type:complete
MDKNETTQDTNAEIEQPVTDESVSVDNTPESISLNDLQLLANIVDLASGRGAFRGAELSQVGAVFDKLQTFLGFVAKQQEERAEQENAEQTEEESQES